MKPQVVLSLAGLLMTFAPGCCVFEAIFGCGHHGHDYCGPVECQDGHHHKKCAKKCRKCRECLEKEGMIGMGYGDYGFAGDCGCGCGGGMMPDMAGGCGCGQGGMSSYEAPSFNTPPMTIPTPSAPPPRSSTALPPPIPPSESSMQQLPPGVQQVSVEEFQRLPGVIVSGPGSQVDSAAHQLLAEPDSVPAMMAAPSLTASPIQTATSTVSSPPANARQIQQTGWAPVRQ